uniref:Chitin-binding type-2 domain-containing protein n=1 Tax=Bactrocera latifrons TaxID=174628 RepID=A0A0K8W8L5_BACLA
MDYTKRFLWLSGILLGPILLAALTLQDAASPVFQNHKTKEWTNLDNITFSFDCTHRPVGFYADMEYNCQIFHMCDEEGNRIPHLCANETSFNQEYRICDWDYNFNCTESPVNHNKPRSFQPLSKISTFHKNIHYFFFSRNGFI